MEHKELATRRFKKRMLQGWLCALALGLGTIATLVIRDSGRKSRTSVDYLAMINRSAREAADEDKAWTIYRDLWIKYGFSVDTSWNEKLFFVKEATGLGELRFVRPSDGDAWIAATNKLSEIEDLLEGFRAGAKRPCLGVPIYIDPTQYSEADFEALFPRRHDQQMLFKNANHALTRPILMEMYGCMPFDHSMSKAARLLFLDTRWSIEKGDVDRATRNIEAMLGFSSQVAESKLLSSSGASYSIMMLTFDLIHELLHSSVAWTDEHLERIHAAVDNLRIEDLIDLSSEHAVVLDFIQKAYSDNGQGDGRITVNGMIWTAELDSHAPSQINPGQEWKWEHVATRLSALRSYLLQASRKQLTDKADELFARADALFKARAERTAFKGLDREVELLPNKYKLLKRLFPPSVGVHDAVIRTKANAESVKTALAVIRFQRQYGRCPSSLDELVGKFLDRVPMDPFDHQPLRYAPKDYGFVIYSVGINRVDDGGQVLMTPKDAPHRDYVSVPFEQQDAAGLTRLPTRYFNLHQPFPGDWVLWPRFSIQ